MEIKIYFTSSWHSSFLCLYLDYIVKSADSRKTDLKKKKKAFTKLLAKGYCGKRFAKTDSMY